jgi:glycosyltransferase involved in cell wall biosynthesis
MSLRVLHLDSAATWRGGQNQVFLTAKGMAARGHDVILGCRTRGPLESRARAEGLDVRPIPFRGDLWPPAIGALARVLRRDRPDVLLLHDPHAVSAGLVASRLAGRPALVAVRRVDFALGGVFSRWKYSSCDRVIVVSQAIGRVVEAGGLASSRLRLVYEGVPDREAQAGGRAELEALGVPAGAPVVGNVAALTGHKDHATLIEAMALLRPRSPEARLVICGEGELRSDLEARVARHGLADRVIFAGFRRDLDRVMPAFDVFCLSSHLEGLGTSVLDAMVFGRPVVATAAGGIPEAVQDGATGRVVPPRDPAALAGALGEVLEDDARRRDLALAGRRRYLDHFTVDRMVEETLKVLGGLP